MHSHYFKDVEDLPHNTNEEKVQQLRKGMEMHPEAKPHYLRTLAWHYSEAKRHDLAIATQYEMINHFEGKDPLEDEDRQYMGEAFQAISYDFKKKGNLERALDYLNKKLDVTKDKQQAFADIARFHRENKEYDKAEEYYKLMLDSPNVYGPQYNQAYYNEACYNSLVAELYVMRKDYKKAIAFHERSLELPDKGNNGYGHVYWSIATVYGHFDKVKQHEYWLKAIKYYEASAEEDENKEPEILGGGYNQTAMSLSGTYYCLKDLYENMGNTKKANYYIKKLGELHKKQAEDPSGNSKEYHESRMADSYRQAGKFKKALEIYERHLAEEEYIENKPGIYSDIAKVHKEAGDMKKATECYIKILEIEPDDEAAVLELAVIYQDDKKPDFARPYLEKYIELCPNKNPRAYSALANCINEKEEPLLFLSYMKKAAELNDDEDVDYACALYNIMAKIHWRVLKDAEAAFECLRKMMALNPTLEQQSDSSVVVMQMSFDPYASNLAMQFMTEFSPKKEKVIERPKLTLDEIKALPYYYENIPTETLAGETYRRNLQKEFREDVINNPKYKDYFKQYDPDTVVDFAFGYAKHKINLVNMAKYYANSSGETSEEYIDRINAEEVFEMILQKKLFNMQVLWRAGNITIPEIEIGYDFEVWGDKIWECPFLEQVTRAEVETMKQFLLDDNYSDSTPWFLHGWQSYHELMEKNGEDDREFMPEWYQFYDGRMGTGAMLLLPDVRGEREAFYTEVYWKWYRNTPRPAVVPVVSAEPPFLLTLHSSEWTYIEFLKTFENDYFNMIQQGMTDEKKFEGEEYEIGDIWGAINEFRASKTPIYFESGLEWHEAILKASKKMKNTKLAERLDGVYEDYLIKRELLGGFNGSDYKALRKNSKDKNRDDTLERILKGRELNKEPRDLNF